MDAFAANVANPQLIALNRTKKSAHLFPYVEDAIKMRTPPPSPALFRV